ncbi:MAG TPA: ABC transporter permease [Gemmatimonadales bacterium]
MARFALRRVLAAILTVGLVVSITFLLAHLAPGQPMLADAERMHADPARIARIRAEFGLDRPLAVQYTMYVGNALRGNLGESFTMRRSVGEILRERLPHTALLAGAALLLAFAAGIAIAAIQATRAGSWTDAGVGAVTLTFHSTPSFWLGLILMVAFGQWLGWLPVGGMTTPVEHEQMGMMGRMVDVGRHLILPALTLALVLTAEIARYQRGALVDALGSEFVRAARAKGLAERAVLLRHALRAALAPVVVLAGMSVPALLAGAVLVETVFGWPGMGRLTRDAIVTRDYNLILGAAIISGALVAIGNLAADLGAHALDPRTR